jgi:hypothetical protein
MSIQMADPVSTMLVAIAAALAVSLTWHGLCRGFRIVRRGLRVARSVRRLITRTEWLSPVTLEITMRLRVEPRDRGRHPDQSPEFSDGVH